MIEFATTWGRADSTGDVTARLQVGPQGLLPPQLLFQQ